jgi:hypothetical protein
MKHHTTTDELAEMINAGVTAVTKDIGEVKQRLDTLDGRVAKGRRELCRLRPSSRRLLSR